MRKQAVRERLCINGAALLICFLFACLYAFLFLAAYTAFVSAAEVSQAEAVVEVSCGRLLHARNERRPLPMASTTKILTALIVIEECDLGAVVTVPRAAIGVEGSSVYLQEGEKLTVRDLLYGLMLRSGNDCALALALHHSGSVEAFAARMNECAAACGAEDSCFCNPHGLPAAGHHTTALDLARIAAQAVQNETFCEIVSAESYQTSDGSRVFQNKNKMLHLYEGADGVKTGYTREAGRCLVTSAARGGMRLVCAVLGSPQMYERSAQLLDDCFAAYKLRPIAEKGQPAFLLPTDVKGKFCRCACDETCTYPLTDTECARLYAAVKLPPRVCLPVRQGQCVGNLQIFLANQLLFSLKIVSIETIDKNILDILREIAQRN